MLFAGTLPTMYGGGIGEGGMMEPGRVCNEYSRPAGFGNGSIGTCDQLPNEFD